MIQLKNICFDYSLTTERIIHALSDINLEIKEGELISIIGPNGSGKTTLARLLNGLIMPSSGKVLVDGLNPKHKKDLKLIRQRVGMVFQNPDNQIITTCVEREIAFGLEYLNISFEEMRERVEWALSAFNLWEYKNSPPHKLSGGEKQKVAIAAVLAMRPKYLVLDEPTSLLSPEDREMLNSLINKLARGLNVTIINITQFPEEAMSAHRILVLDRGKLFLDGSPHNVFGESKKLKEIGLSIPKSLEIADRLKSKGFKFKRKITNMEDLILELDNSQGINLQLPLKDNKSEKDSQGKVVSADEHQIELEKLGYIYNPKSINSKEALIDVNLKIKKGEFVGLIGPTGSGKSTLVQHFNALLFATSGDIWIDGLEIKENKSYLKKIRKEIGLVFQFPEKQFFEETVYNETAFGPRNSGLKKEEISIRVSSSLKAVGLNYESFAQRSPFSLSSGEQRRAAIAGILALEPRALILDEPTAGLDFEGISRIKNTLIEINNKGVTVILISHNLDIVAELCSRIIFLKEGRVLYDGSKLKFFRDIEKLRQLRIALPEIVELSHKLRAAGFQIRDDIYEIEDLVNELAFIFWKSKK